MTLPGHSSTVSKAKPINSVEDETILTESKNSTAASSFGKSTQSTRFKANFSHSINAHDRVFAAVHAAIDKKALDVTALDLRAASDIADYFVIASGTSDRQVRTIVDGIKEELKLLGESPSSMNGYESAEWVLLDYGDLIIHVFYEPTRQFYRFDELWKSGTPIALPSELAAQSKKLRTGIYR